MQAEQLANVQQTVKEGQKKYSRTNWIMVLCGTAGFVISTLLLFGFPWNNEGRFHEIDLNLKKADSIGREKLLLVIPAWKDSLEKSLSQLKTAQPPDEDEISKLKKQVDSVKLLQDKLLGEKEGWIYSNSDTVTSIMTRFMLHRDDLLNAVGSFGKRGDTLSYKYAIPEYKHQQVTVEVPIVSTPFVASRDLITKYPNFGFWAFIAIFFMVMCSLMVPISWYMFNSITKEIKSLNPEQGKNGRSFVIAIAGVTIFCLVLYGGMIQTFIAKDKYFMHGFRVAILVYTLIGYVVAVYCFAGYLYIADFIHQLQGAFIAGTEKLQALVRDETDKAGTDKDKLAAIPELLAVKAQTLENDAIKEHYKKAKKYFNIFLWMSALVLSVAVLMTASLFSSFNSMNVFQYYRHISGRNFLSADLVFLYGGLHTILLLIYVLPVKFKMYDMNLTIPDLQDGNAADGKTVKGALSGLGKTIGEILVIASPLLASFLENVVSAFFN